MKKLLCITLFISCFFYGLSQSPASKINSTALPTPGARKYSSSSTNSGLDTLKHNICVNKRFSLVFYIVLDTILTGPTPGVGYATPSNINGMVNELNRAFNPICVSFSNCATYFIPNYNYGKTWRKDITEANVTASYYTDKTINIYLVDSCWIGGGNFEPFGYTYLPTPGNLIAPKKDLIVLEKFHINAAFGSQINHFMGHYFGLYNTHDEIAPVPPAVPAPASGIASQEFVDGSNCHVHGDGFCDTDADPGDNLYLVDGMGNYYIYPFDNFMSVYSARNKFSNEQYNFMAYTILQKRFYLH